jgi:protein TonB
MQPLPETLPDDFSEWDSGNPVAAQSVNFNVSASVAGESLAATPPLPSANPQYKVVAVLDGSTDLPRFTARSFHAADDSLLRSFRSKEANQTSPKRTTMIRTIVTAVAVASILLLLALVPRMYPGWRPGLARVKQSIASLSATAGKDLAGNKAKPSPSKPLIGTAQPPAVTPNPAPSIQPATGADPATDNVEEATPPPVQSKMMTDQLAAPSQIPHEIKTVPQKEAPPASGFGGSGMEGLDSSGANVIGGVFAAGNNRPKVKPEPAKVTISSGVAAGMFLHGAKPQYPAIAKSAHVSGTVVLQATISKTGTIENLHVITGPVMLRQAAVDAVSSWQYRPYLLNGQPVAMDTTINVVFTAPGE